MTAESGLATFLAISRAIWEARRISYGDPAIARELPMNTAPSCPNPADLQRYLLGKLAQGEIAPIEEHLAWCEQCSKTLHTLPAEDTMVTAIRQAGKKEAPAPRPPLVARLIDGIRSAGVVETRPAQDDVAELLKLCQPPESAEEMGRFGPFRLRRVIGSGGMAVVFLAEDAQLRRLVALKVLKPSVAARLGARERFSREARAAAAIRHENVVAIYGVGEEADIPYMFLEYLEGEPLDALLLREGSLPLAEALAIARQIAEGVAAAHLLGLIHRDIKPANIFLVRDPHSSPDGDAGGQAVLHRQPNVKVLDFGLARFALDNPQLTHAGTVLGTPAFMSPEQARRETVDRRSDIFSLGCVLYRMCTGLLPFRGADTMAVLMSLAVDDPEPPRALNPEIPPALSDLILRMLAKQPADRPGSVAEVINALIDLEQPAHPSGTVRQSGKLPVVSPRNGRNRPASAPWSARPLIAAAAAVGGVVLTAMIGTLIYIQTDRGELIVESTDKNIDVVVEQAGAKIVDRDDGRTFTVRVGSQQLPSGRYWLDVGESSGLVFSTEEFEITRGGERRVKVSLRPKPPTAPAPRTGDYWYGSLAFWFTADQLVTHDEIVRELKLTAGEQEAIRAAWETSKSSAAAAESPISAINKRIAAIREAVGDKARRLDQIAAQSAGLATLFLERPNRRAPQLGITAEQLAQGRQILDAIYLEMLRGDISAAARTAFVEKSTPKLLELLTDEQKSRWQEALGEPVSVELLAIVRGGPKRAPAVPATPPVVVWVWPAEDLRLGKIAAPDFTAEQPLLDADFATPEKRVIGKEITTEFFDRAFTDDRYLIRHKGPQATRFSTEPCGKMKGSFAIEVTARVIGEGRLRMGGDAAGGERVWRDREGWGVVLAGPEDRGFSLKLSRGGLITLLGPPKKVHEFPGPKLAPITHSKIDTGDSDNTLLVVLHHRNLEIYANGVAVAQPIPFDRELLPADVLLGFFPLAQGSQVEFRRARIWSAEKLPPLDQRGAVLAK
jgi:serine/threonine protein kinase